LSDNQKLTIKRYALSFARVGVAALAMYLAFRNQDWGDTWKKVQVFEDPEYLVILVLSMLLLFANQIIVASRWYLLLRLQVVDIGIYAAIKLTFVGFFYNNFLPGSVGGDVLRAWYVTKHTPKRLEAAISVFVDRIIGLVGLIISAIVAFMLFPKRGEAENLLSSKISLHELWTEYWWILATLFGVVSLTLIFMTTLPKTRQLLRSGCGYVVTTGRHLFIKTSKAVFLYCRRPVWMLALLGMTLFCQTLFIFGLWLVGRKLGITSSFAYYLVFIPVSWVIGMVPISIGGVGVMEATLIILFGLIGVNGNLAGILALCQRLAFWVVALPGMFIHITGSHVPEEFSIDSEAGIN
jgi:glycosyltransferase 2 family protein